MEAFETFQFQRRNFKKDDSVRLKIPQSLSMNASGERMMRRPQWVFVCGCARSGTSTMADLLRSHPSFAMGRERFGRRYRSRGTLSPELFKKDRFCAELVDGDSHHSTLDGYYEALRPRFDSCTHVGDKIPFLHTGYEEISRVFSGVKFVFMLRDVYEVALSFERRAEHTRQTKSAGWPADRGWRVAVDEWNLSLANTIAALHTGSIHVVMYEQLYRSDEQLQNLFLFLNAEVDKAVEAFHSKARAQRERIENDRDHALTRVQEEYITNRADFDSYNALVRASETGTR